MYHSIGRPIIEPPTAEDRHRADLERQREQEDAERVCFVCGEPAAATWVGGINTVSVCAACSRSVLPAMAADAALADRRGVPADVPFCRLALHQVVERFWAAVSHRLERTRREEVLPMTALRAAIARELALIHGSARRLEELVSDEDHDLGTLPTAALLVDLARVSSTLDRLDQDAEALLLGPDAPAE